MELLEQKIIKEGKILPGNILKVGNFLNQQIDVELLDKMAEEIINHYNGKKITKVMTVEASGIALACAVARLLKVRAVFAKKNRSSNVDGESYTAECYSYTHNKTNTLDVPKEYLSGDDKVLIVDDFLANGAACNALTDIVIKSGAELVGVAIQIEKGFQPGGAQMRAKGIDVFSLAIIEEMTDNGIVFRK